MSTKKKTKYIAKKRKKPSSPRLKAWLDAGKNETVLVGPVALYLQTRPDVRDASIIHPSEMAKSDWCQRATWHRLRGDDLLKETAPDSLRSEVIFAEGHDIHRKWQTWTREMGVLWGLWRCIHCYAEIKEWSDNLVSTRCDNGATSHQWEYKEVPLAQRPLRIGGHADGVVNPDAEESFVLEAKSVGPGTLRKLDLISDDEADFMGSNAFSKISRPLPQHFRQAQIYLRLAQDPEITAATGPINRAIVLYEYKADQQIREFIVTYNSRWTDEMFDVAQDIVWALSHDREIRCPYGGCAQCKAYEEA